MTRRGWLVLGGLLCLAGAGICGAGIYREWKPRQDAEAVYAQARVLAFGEREESGEPGTGGGISGGGTARAEPDFTALLAWNPDIRGWLYAPGTEIDYPVVQGTDNVYYLNHTAAGSRSIIGSIFMESGNQGDYTDDLTVLYGHHIQGGRMFSSLAEYKRQEYYEEHPFLYLYTPERNYEIVLFAGQILDGETGGFPLRFGSGEERGDWLEQVLYDSTFRSRVRPEMGERMIALCTCTYEYQNARYAIYGVMREREERV